MIARGLSLLLSALVAASLAGCGREDSARAATAQQGPPPVPAKVREVKPQPVPIVLEAVGQAQGSKEVEVRARVSGILLKRLYNEGQRVQAGAPLFQIDPATYEIALQQARAQLAQEQARQEQTRREAGRLKELAQQKAISQKEFDDAVSAEKLSAGSLQAAEARVREAELNLSYTKVTAPVSGVTGRIVRSEGSLVSPGADSLLTTINQVQPIWVRFSLSESDLAKLPGRRVDANSAEVRVVLADGSEYPVKGRINFAAAQIDPRLATQELRAEFDNPRNRILPGDFVRVRLTGGQYKNAFLVPQQAVFQTEKGQFVFVLDGENKASVRPVKTGEWIGQDWLILDGLQPGDRVVVDNLMKLRPGAPVAPQLADAGPAAAQGAAPAGGAPQQQRRQAPAGKAPASK
ncbi:MAG TPA: efflux RND transporter periplasmic adaptor subunit [Burkholderiales bacterium]|nr:efflux RND transporter periplasmic adaptor subunit [Burkholderiales bacterium]